MIAAIVATVLVAGSAAGALPMPDKELRFSSQYSVSGILSMPHLGMKESFTATHDGKSERSRVDYHQGETKTFRKGSDLHKVSWSPNEESHALEERCHTMSADANENAVTGVIPDPTDFEFVRIEACNTDRKDTSDLKSFHDSECYRFEKRTRHHDRVSQSVFWITLSANKILTPVRFSMTGYDNVLGSNFDEFEVVYRDFTPEASDESRFDVRSVTDKPCAGIASKPGLRRHHLFDPLKEFVHNDASHVDQHFANFKDQHGKFYNSVIEERQRRHNFHQNMRYVDSMNRRNLTYALALNDRADWSRDELESSGRLLSSLSNATDSRPVTEGAVYAASIPDYIDWRDSGAVTPVKDQGPCLSCWAFAAVGHLESMYFLKYGKLLELSEQELVDCSWDYGNKGCVHGGSPWRAFEYVKERGLSSAEQYGPYLAEGSSCKKIEISRKPITGLKKTISGPVIFFPVQKLRRVVATHGPVAVALHTGAFGSRFYSHGVYKSDECSRLKIDHAVLVVGYGTLPEPYWLIKNSWGTSWGSNGYARVSQESDCGITLLPSYVEL